jgi:hypothetical protein
MRNAIAQLFLGFVVLGLAAERLGLGVVSETALGRPLAPPSRIASKADFRYMPAEPMYLKGSMPFRLSLILTAADETPSSWAISNTVISFIHENISAKPPVNQDQIDKMLQHFHILLYGCIVICQKISRILQIFFQNLDRWLGLVYIVYMLQHCNDKKRLPEAPVAERTPIGAKGDFNERVRKLGAMA